MTKAVDYLVQPLLIDLLFMIVKLLNQVLNIVSKIILIFYRKHADKVDNELHEIWKLEVDIVNKRDKNLFV